MLKAALLSLCLLLISVMPVGAAGFVLNSIGSLQTQGNQYPEWWYQGDNPTLAGTAAPNATVDVNVGGTSQTVTADNSGNWSAATSVTTGDHTVTLTSGGSTITFTLHLDQTMPEGVNAPAAATQPTAGVALPTLLLVLGGTVLALTGFFSRRRLVQ